MELAKSFEPADIEQYWRSEWEKRGYFAATLDADKPSFSIQLPPPNVTGTLHMGHAFNQTIMDGLTRYYRMRGYNTAWIPGTLLKLVVSLTTEAPARSSRSQTSR